MRLSTLVLIASIIVAGCTSPGEEPTENQKKLVPEAANGKPVTAPGDKFTRQSDRN